MSRSFCGPLSMVLWTNCLCHLWWHRQLAHKRHQQRPTQQQLMFAGVSARRAETCNRATDSWFRRLPTHTAHAAQTVGAHTTQMAQTVGPHTNDTAQIAQTVSSNKWHSTNGTDIWLQIQVTRHSWHRQLAPTQMAQHRWHRRLPTHK